MSRNANYRYAKGSMKKFLIVGILLLTGAYAALAYTAEPSREPEDFRGLKWGISVSEAHKIIQEQWDKRREAGETLVSGTKKEEYVDDRTRRILYRDKIGTATVGILLDFLDEKFVSVILTFEPKDFNQIESAFRARYGKPTVDRRVPLNNAFGATFVDQQLLWQFKSLRIALTKYADANTGGASLEKTTWTNYEATVDHLKKRKAAGDL